MRPEAPKLYAQYAEWWPLLSPVASYREEARLLKEILSSGARGVKTVLELGSGGGNNAFHLKQTYQMTLVDLSPGMLAVSRRLNPDCEHVQGDMRAVRLGRTFDAVFIHDAVMYMVTEDDLERVLETARLHCNRDGLLLLVPDCFKETFRPGTKHGGTDAEGRGLRYLEWNYDPDPHDQTYTVDFAYLFRDRNGEVRVDHDRHTLGLFPEATWLRLLDSSGFDGKVVPLDHSELEPDLCKALLGVRR